MLAVLLWDEITALTELQDLLLKEYAALQTRDIVKLNQITAEKQVCTDRLHTLTEQHTDYLLKWGSSTCAMQTCIASCKPSERSQLEALWVKLEEILTQVKRQNEINGAIITASRGHIECALIILHGRNLQNGFYSSDAQMTFGSSHRTLAKA